MKGIVGGLIPQTVLTNTSYKRKEQDDKTQRKIVEQNLEQESLSGEKDIEEAGESMNNNWDKKVVRCRGKCSW